MDSRFLTGLSARFGMTSLLHTRRFGTSALHIHLFGVVCSWDVLHSCSV